jgi:plasmid maintenance system antidote protein VapI
MTNLRESARQYVVANGGHATMAATLGVPVNHLADVTAGRAVSSNALAVQMASILGCTVWAFKTADADSQLLTRRGSIPA